MPNMTQEEIKLAVKEAHKEWLNEQFQAVGVWTFRTFLALLFTALIYFMLTANGWQPKKKEDYEALPMVPNRNVSSGASDGASAGRSP